MIKSYYCQGIADPYKTVLHATLGNSLYNYYLMVLLSVKIKYYTLVFTGKPSKTKNYVHKLLSWALISTQSSGRDHRTASI